MNIEALIQRLAQLTVPSTDDGVQFVRTDRLERIRGALDGSAYRCLGDVPLAVLYSHRDYQPSRPTILISNHIDSVYDDYFCDAGEATIRGTFDNSACNAVAVELMLPCRVLGADMHDNDGVAIRRDSLIAYAKALAQLVQSIDKDLAERVMGRHATNP